MKALVYTGAEAMDYRDAPEPVENDSLIQVEAVGICGSDMHAYLGHDERRPAPLILGHEAAGTVLKGVQEGKRVTVNPLVPCGACKACLEGRENICATRQIISMPPREGAFAERMSMPAENLVEVPDGFAIEKAALAEPLSVCWHAVKLAESRQYTPFNESKCLVLGGGAIGVGTALCLKAFGATDVVVVEPNKERAAVVSASCGLEMISPDAVDAGTYDAVYDAVGYRGTREAACRAVRPGGIIVHIGLGDAKDGLDIRYMTLQEVTFIGNYYYTKQDFRETCTAMFNGRLGDLGWTDMRALSEGAQAFADLRAGKVASPKIVLNP